MTTTSIDDEETDLIPTITRSMRQDEIMIPFETSGIIESNKNKTKQIRVDCDNEESKNENRGN
jgi:hypothetical protein